MSHDNYIMMIEECIDSEAAKLYGKVPCSNKEWHEAMCFFFGDDIKKFVKEYGVDISVTKLRLLIVSKMIQHFIYKYKKGGEHARISRTLRKRAKKIDENIK